MTLFSPKLAPFSPKLAPFSPKLAHITAAFIALFVFACTGSDESIGSHTAALNYLAPGASLQPLVTVPESDWTDLPTCEASDLNMTANAEAMLNRLEFGLATRAPELVVVGNESDWSCVIAFDELDAQLENDPISEELWVRYMRALGTEADGPTPEPAKTAGPTPEPAKTAGPTPEPARISGPTPEPADEDGPTPEPALN